MRDVSAGRDIVNSTIMEIVGAAPTIELLQQPAEELAEAEKLSRLVVSAGRKRRAKTAVVLSAIMLIALVAACLFGYHWLLQGGELTLQEIIRDSSNVTLGAAVSTAVSALVGIASGVGAFRQVDPSEAEKLNTERLRVISIRWEELRLLGFPKAEMRQLRRRG